MVVLIDSSVLIAAERGAINWSALAGREDEPQVAMAAITASELLHGVHRADVEDRRTRREAYVERLLATLPVLPFDLTAARLHARIWADLASRGLQVGAHDLLIAATALAAGGAVATRDTQSFSRIPGLTVLSW
jgi:predicted nucleic acid-binding protein